MWALDVLSEVPTGLDGLTAREILKSGKSVIQWEFSATPLRSWALLLATILILEQLERSVEATKDDREKKETEQVVKGMAGIHASGWCQCM